MLPEINADQVILMPTFKFEQRNKHPLDFK